MAKKQLGEMSNRELSKLFPIILNQYNPLWPKLYETEKDLIVDAVGDYNVARISHIGSTAVPGLIAKPTVDILLEIGKSADLMKLIDNIKSAGYMYSVQPNNPAPHMMFMKGYTEEGFKGQAFHLHVRYPGDWDELYFRDYLIAHKDAADDYAELKFSLLPKFTHNRDGYTAAKADFIKKITLKAHAEYSSRYKLL